MNYRSTDEVATTVLRMDADRRATLFRDPDRPDAKFVPSRRQRQPAEVTKAQARVRTDRWRTSMDRRRAPTAAQLGMSLVTALARSDLNELTPDDRGLVGAMLVDLDARGFSLNEARETLRRLRDRVSDPSSATSGVVVDVPSEKSANRP